MIGIVPRDVVKLCRDPSRNGAARSARRERQRRSIIQPRVVSFQRNYPGSIPANQTANPERVASNWHQSQSPAAPCRKNSRMNSQALTRIESKELAAETAVFTAYLQQLGLPVDNIIASTAERTIIAGNLPILLESLPPEEKRDARYLSKFVGATAIGLFDAALNYVWNEVVLNLRKKACLYGIELFFDAAVGGKTRDLYKDENDLGGLKDTVLLDTCRKLELVSDVVYRKLDHILTMRNEVAASHPNVEKIGGFELLGWLQTCMKDVLQDRPSESAIHIRAFVDNLKSRTDAIDDNTANRLSNELKNLSLPHLHNLLITIFGIFVSAEASQVLRVNVAKILLRRLKAVR